MQRKRSTHCLPNKRKCESELNVPVRFHHRFSNITSRYKFGGCGGQVRLLYSPPVSIARPSVHKLCHISHSYGKYGVRSATNTSRITRCFVPVLMPICEDENDLTQFESNVEKTRQHVCKINRVQASYCCSYY